MGGMCSKDDALDEEAPVENRAAPAVGEALEEENRLKAIEAEQNRIAAEEQAKRDEERLAKKRPKKRLKKKPKPPPLP